MDVAMEAGRFDAAGLQPVSRESQGTTIAQWLQDRKSLRVECVLNDLIYCLKYRRVCAGDLVESNARGGQSQYRSGGRGDPLVLEPWEMTAGGVCFIRSHPWLAMLGDLLARLGRRSRVNGRVLALDKNWKKKRRSKGGGRRQRGQRLACLVRPTEALTAGTAGSAGWSAAVWDDL